MTTPPNHFDAIYFRFKTPANSNSLSSQMVTTPQPKSDILDQILQNGYTKTPNSGNADIDALFRIAISIIRLYNAHSGSSSSTQFIQHIQQFFNSNNPNISQDFPNFVQYLNSYTSIGDIQKDITNLAAELSKEPGF
jgi:hypothetical protein